MRSTCSAWFSLLAAALVLTAGCRNRDPFGEMRRTPQSPGSFYTGAGDERPVIVPRRVPDLENGPLSLAQCIHISLENSPHARMSWQNARAAASAVGQARSGLLPKLDFTADAQRNKIQVLTGVGRQYTQTTYTATFGVRQLLFDAGATRAGVDAAEASLRMADFRHNSLLLDLALATEVSYYQLLATKSLLRVAEDSVTQRKRHLELAQRRHEAGVGRWVDVLQAKAEKASAELTVVETRSQIRIARGRLASVMGLRPSTPIEVIDIPEASGELERRDVHTLMETAAWHRPTLKAGAAEVMRIRRELYAQRAGRWPTVEAGLNFGWTDTHVLMEESDEWGANVSLRWPLFTGFQRTYSIEQAQANLWQAVDAYEKLLRDVELEVWTAYSEVLRAEEAINAADSYVEAARESLNVAEKGYQEGRATIVELTDAQTEQTRALARRVGIHLDWYSALARLERAVGRSFDEQEGQPEAPEEPVAGAEGEQGAEAGPGAPAEAEPR